MAEVKKTIKRKFVGTVISHNSDKTILVEVKRTRLHPKYFKRYVITKKYQVHDEKNEYKTGDQVNFIECRPFSKHKCWRVLSKVK